jgi:Flp pilus assembly protein TadG
VNRHRRRGANAIELALLLPLMLALIAGVSELGFYFAREATFRHAVVRALRVGAGTPIAEDPVDRFEASLTTELAARRFEVAAVSVNDAIVGDAGNRFLEVTVSLPWGGLTGLLPGPAALVTTQRVRMEDQEPLPGLVTGSRSR